MKFFFKAKYHLPDVTCSSCGKEISPLEIHKHRQKCKKNVKKDQDEVESYDNEIKDEVENNMKAEEIVGKKEDSFCGNEQQAENPFFEAKSRTSVRMVFEGKKYSITLDENKSMKKAMRKMATTLGRDCNSLLFTTKDKKSCQLTGREMAGDMEGISINVSFII